jgi:uncharacterized protein (UPF0335 family)
MMTAADIAEKHNATVKSPAKAGHNSNAQLKAFVERIERLEEEKQTFVDDIKDVYAEAKGNGYHVPALRALIARRKKDAAKLKELEDFLDVYMNAMGMIE